MFKEKSNDSDDIKQYGGIDLPTIQKYINFHFTVSEDLFGAEKSTNAANYYTASIKGRYQESRIVDDHKLVDDAYKVIRRNNGSFQEEEMPALDFINERLRDDYIADCQRGVDRWNKIIADNGIKFPLKLPHRAFHRAIGDFADLPVSPEGKTDAEARLFAQ